MTIYNIICCLSLFLIISHQVGQNSVQAVNIDKEHQAQNINNCPREFTNWNLINKFETETYSLALCQQGDILYLVGHQKEQHEAFITAKVLSQTDDLIIAEDEYGLYFEINSDELRITQDNQIIAQENLLDSELREIVWQLQEIRYNNNEFIVVNNPADYTIKFLAEGQLSIKADCNPVQGTYTQKDSRISIQISPTTMAICSPESISEQFLKELQAAAILFFQDGNLYFDLKFDTGTMRFTPAKN